MAWTLGELAGRIGGEVAGDPGCVITGVATLQNARPGDITFLANPRYRKYLISSEASAAIVSSADRDACPANALVVKNPYVAYARVAALLCPAAPFASGVQASASIATGCDIDETAFIGANAVVESGVVIGRNVYVGPGCVVGPDVRIGDDSRLVANVTVCRGVTIGARALMHPGVVLGGDGFGLANDNGVWIKVPQLGGVRIGDDVEIGANSTVDRGALDDTVLEDGVKLDNQIQIGHNVIIGAHTAIAGCVGIAGSTKIGRRCTIGGGAGISGHLDIVDDVHITGMSFVLKSITAPGVYSSGMPAESNIVWRKNMARLRHLDELARRVGELKVHEK